MNEELMQAVVSVFDSIAGRNRTTDVPSAMSECWTAACHHEADEMIAMVREKLSARSVDHLDYDIVRGYLHCRKHPELREGWRFPQPQLFAKETDR